MMFNALVNLGVRKKKLILLALFLFLGAISVAQGIKNALHTSQDFQWSPTVLLLHGINPYQYYLDGNPDGFIILSQAPNYAHVMYLMLVPFALLAWSKAKLLWAVTNTLLAVICAFLLGKSAKQKNADLLLIIAIFLASTPSRVAIGNGQQSLMILLFSCAIYIGKDFPRAICLGAMYAKYSFAPPFFLFIIMKNRISVCVSSLFFCVIGWLIFSLFLKQNPMENLLLPLKVNVKSVGDGVADLMTIAGFFRLNVGSAVYIFLAYFLPLSVCLISAAFIARKSHGSLYCHASLSLIALITFKHLNYDFVFLLPAFVYFYENRALKISQLGMVLIFLIWFGEKIIFSFNLIREVPLVFLSFFVVLGIIFCLFRAEKANDGKLLIALDSVK